MSDEKQELAIRNSDLRELMKLAHFRGFLWEALADCEIYSSHPGKYVAGKRAVGLGLIEKLNDADPTLYAKLLLERSENE